MKVLIVMADKYTQLKESDLQRVRSNGKVINTLFSNFLGCDTIVLQGNQLSRPEVITSAIDKLINRLSADEGFVFYYMGRSQELVRNGKKQTLLALNTFLPGKTKGSIGMDNIIEKLVSIKNSLIVLDTSAESLNYELVLSDNNMGSYVISCFNYDHVTCGNNATQFSISFDRALRYAYEVGMTSFDDIVEKIYSDVKFLTGENTVLFGNYGKKSFVLDFKFSEASRKPLFEFYNQFKYLAEDLYNCSEGSREDGVNDLESLLLSGSDIERHVSRDLLCYLLNIEPSNRLKSYIASIMNPNKRIHNVIDTSGIDCKFIVPEMILIPSGRFIMGTNLEFVDKFSRPAHEVYLDEYSISKYLVTIEEYIVFVNECNYGHPTNWIDLDWIHANMKHPVTCVSYYDATAYCKWLERKLECNEVRLPTEAEWEKAARSTDGRLYPWGNGYSSNFANTKSTAIMGTTQVGTFSPQGDSSYGCVDMIGNVREWTSSLWGVAANVPQFKYPYSRVDGRENFDAGNNYKRVIRGGGYYYDDECANCVVRNRAIPNNIHQGGGFRIVFDRVKR